MQNKRNPTRKKPNSSVFFYIYKRKLILINAKLGGLEANTTLQEISVGKR
jgi:hypothetical protein